MTPWPLCKRCGAEVTPGVRDRVCSRCRAAPRRAESEAVNRYVARLRETLPVRVFTAAERKALEAEMRAAGRVPKPKTKPDRVQWRRW